MVDQTWESLWNSIEKIQARGKSILATKIILAPLKKKEIVPTIVGNHPGKILNLGRAVVDQIT